MEKGIIKDESAPLDTEVLSVEGYVYEKVKKTDININIPQKPIYFQAFNHRVVTGLFPILATWERNQVYALKIVQITSEHIFTTTVYTDAKHLSEIISRFEIKNKSRRDILIDEVVRYLKNFYTDDRITQKTFLDAYNDQLNEISDIIRC